MSPPLSPLSSLPSSPILQEATHKEGSNQNEEKYFWHARLQHSSKESASKLRSPKFAEGQS
ncbi:hypothetical protein PISMIDRAFT_20181 [Pisolithus microcarpus 441]|uniref:Uncharacterized protein n=1 Tax=Pisolithus microcarpus 441 TaxID=765257 RepID=A0A0C9Y9I0_9AGAM|nr:hypothetical protein PISMIDRAFT_20181 [Pisolithus microcarpus 441]